MMSDAPAHHLFCLLGPVEKNTKSLPEVLCVIQVTIKLSIDIYYNIISYIPLLKLTFYSGVLGRTSISNISIRSFKTR